MIARFVRAWRRRRAIRRGNRNIIPMPMPTAEAAARPGYSHSFALICTLSIQQATEPADRIRRWMNGQ